MLKCKKIAESSESTVSREYQVTVLQKKNKRALVVVGISSLILFLGNYIFFLG